MAVRTTKSSQHINFDPRFTRDLAQLFGAATALELARKGRVSLVEALLPEARLGEGGPSSPTYAEVFEAAYTHLWEHYRAEYVYKNTLVRKIVLGRHSLATTRVFAEFRVGEAKADLLMVNGTTTVYEVKTALDSLDRLAGQLASYCRAVDQVFVVTHPAAVRRVSEAADARAGIIVLTDRGTLSTVRPASSNRHQVDPAVIFESLRRSEYLKALRARFGAVPDLPNTMIHAACKRLFTTLKPEEAHGILANALRERMLPASTVSLVGRAPAALSAVCLAAGFRDRDAVAFEQHLAARPQARAMRRPTPAPKGTRPPPTR